ncbi:MAG: peptidyl-prolyl cis-trans isomerase [Deltaproteobacteria bacterium]|nr:peptidyl-prolyl cis-trans isomerase [Deltaproteobacteria bacterium]
MKTWARQLKLLTSTLPLCVLLGCPDPNAPRPYPQPDVAPGGKTVVKIGQVNLTDTDLKKRFDSQSPFMRAKMKDSEKRKEFIEQVTRMELFAQEAWSRKLYDDPVVIGEMKKAMIQQLMKNELDGRIAKVEVTDAEIQAEYEKKRDEFVKPEKVRLSQILRKGAATEVARLEKLRADIQKSEKASKVTAFADAARAESQDEATKTSGGDLNFLGREEVEKLVGPEATQKVFGELQVGDSIVAKTADGAVLLKLTGRRRAIERTVDQVKPQLKNQILRDKRGEIMEQFVGELKKKYNLSIDDAALSAIEVDMTAPTPTPMAGMPPGAMPPGAMPPGGMAIPPGAPPPGMMPPGGIPPKGGFPGTVPGPKAPPSPN